MSKIVRSARGEVVDFELIAIKAQLAATPAPKVVEERKQAIDVRDGVKTDVQPDLELQEMLAVASQAASTSAAQAKTIKRK